MRLTRAALAGAALAAGLALPAAPAAAVCNPWTYELTGMCNPPCTVLAIAYGTVDRAADDRLPDEWAYCVA